jgi:hypothetical protein
MDIMHWLDGDWQKENKSAHKMAVFMLRFLPQISDGTFWNYSTDSRHAAGLQLPELQRTLQCQRHHVWGVPNFLHQQCIIWLQSVQQLYARSTSNGSWTRCKKWTQNETTCVYSQVSSSTPLNGLPLNVLRKNNSKNYVENFRVSLNPTRKECKCVHCDVAKRLHQGVLYFLNNTRFHGHGLVPKFTKLTNGQL